MKIALFICTIVALAGEHGTDHELPDVGLSTKEPLYEEDLERPSQEGIDVPEFIDPDIPNSLLSTVRTVKNPLVLTEEEIDAEIRKCLENSDTGIKPISFGTRFISEVDYLRFLLYEKHSRHERLNVKHKQDSMEQERQIRSLEASNRNYLAGTIILVTMILTHLFLLIRRKRHTKQLLQDLRS